MSEKQNKKWKDFLLKSGIPLEYEVKKVLESFGCAASFEYTYLRNDENEIENEFSYDIDAAYIKGNHFFELMLECKYRDPSTRWLFTPENYGGMDETSHHGFLHPNDHFTDSNKFLPFPYDPAGPLCGKGIEINSNGSNPKTITQATNQLAYAMAEKIASGIEHQIDKLLGSTSDFIFYNVPIIVTTANLYRLKSDIKISEIQNSSDIEEISEKESCVILKTPVGKQLERYNLTKLLTFMNSFGSKKLKDKMNTFNDDLPFVLSVIAKNYCPNTIAVIQHNESNLGMKKIFSLINEVISPSDKTLENQRKREERMAEISKKINKMKNEKRNITIDKK